MKHRHIVSLGVAAGALVVSAPAMAQPEMTYGQKYEYAQPATAGAPVVYTQNPVVQPVPTHTAHQMPHNGADYTVERAPIAHHAPVTHHAPVVHHAPMHSQPIVYPAGHHGGYPQQTGFDRNAWLDECEARYEDSNYGGRRDRNGRVIGGIVGAAAGGLIGNRVADGDRLAGTLIGAGVGGIAGAIVGSAVDSRSRRNRTDASAYCEDYLARYSGGYNYGYQHQQMMLVPVMVQVPQRAVVREYVTEEYVDVPVTTYETVPAKRTIHYAPAPVKRVKTIKSAPVKRVKYRKGK